MKKRPELLSPAGTLTSMRYAFAYGADAVYAGMPKYSLRVRTNTFKRDDILAQGIEEAHALGKQLFVAANLFPHNPKVKTFINDLQAVIDLKPDGLIMADPGLIMMVRETWPEVPVHLSVQMNTVNYASVKFWQKLGVTRVILSRELSLDEIAMIRQECPDIELEVFVHGALCIAYSGRCLLSGYFTRRDSNQGACTNSCRWKYDLSPTQENACGDLLPADALQNPELFSETGLPRHPLADKTYFLEEQERPGELMPVMEDEHGTYIMNSKDLRAIEHVQRLVDIGIDCLKIEGRTKSHYYVARTAQIYKKAIDLAVKGEPLDPKLIGALENLANRGYTDGFYQRHHSSDHQNYMMGASRTHKQQFVGEATGRKTDGAGGDWLIIDVKNKFEVGDKLEYILPSGENLEVTLDTMLDKNNTPITTAPGNGHTVQIPAHSVEGDMVLVSRFLPE